MIRATFEVQPLLQKMEGGQLIQQGNQRSFTNRSHETQALKDEEAEL